MPWRDRRRRRKQAEEWRENQRRMLEERLGGPGDDDGSTEDGADDDVTDFGDLPEFSQLAEVLGAVGDVDRPSVTDEADTTDDEVDVDEVAGRAWDDQDTGAWARPSDRSAPAVGHVDLPDSPDDVETADEDATPDVGVTGSPDDGGRDFDAAADDLPWARADEPDEPSWARTDEPDEPSWARADEPDEPDEPSWARADEPDEPSWARADEPDQPSWARADDEADDESRARAGEDDGADDQLHESWAPTSPEPVVDSVASADSDDSPTDDPWLRDAPVNADGSVASDDSADEADEEHEADEADDVAAAPAEETAPSTDPWARDDQPATPPPDAAARPAATVAVPPDEPIDGWADDAEPSSDAMLDEGMAPGDDVAAARVTAGEADDTDESAVDEDATDDAWARAGAVATDVDTGEPTADEQVTDETWADDEVVAADVGTDEPAGDVDTDEPAVDEEFTDAAWAGDEVAAADVPTDEPAVDEELTDAAWGDEAWGDEVAAADVDHDEPALDEHVSEDEHATEDPWAREDVAVASAGTGADEESLAAAQSVPGVAAAVGAATTGEEQPVVAASPPEEAPHPPAPLGPQERPAVPVDLGEVDDDEYARAVRRAVSRALAEDLGDRGDVTSMATVPVGMRGRAVLVAREAGVVAGLDAINEVVRQVDGRIHVRVFAEDGDRVEPGDLVARLSGPLRTLLTAERTLLNLVCQLSGVATLTAAFVEAIDGHDCVVRDTRKTTPGLRLLEKRAVRAGGGANHRIGLHDAMLVKDNHVAAAGGVAAAARAALDGAPDGVHVQVEVTSIEGAQEAIREGVVDLLLDNFAPDDLRRAVEAVAGRAAVEASGGITLETAAAYAGAGADRLAVGALTHSAPSLDLALDVEEVLDHTSGEARRRPAAADAFGPPPAERSTERSGAGDDAATVVGEADAAPAATEEDAGSEHPVDLTRQIFRDADDEEIVVDPAPYDDVGHETAVAEAAVAEDPDAARDGGTGDEQRDDADDEDADEGGGVFDSLDFLRRWD